MEDSPVKIDPETGRLIVTRDIPKGALLTLNQEEYRALSVPDMKLFIGQEAILNNGGLPDPYSRGSLVVVYEQSEEDEEKPFGILLVSAQDLKPDRSHPVQWVSGKDLILTAQFSRPRQSSDYAYTLDDLGKVVW